jgi:hypothetical protein
MRSFLSYFLFLCWTGNICVSGNDQEANGTSVVGYAQGVAGQVKFRYPAGMALWGKYGDAEGDAAIYVADTMNNVIRRAKRKEDGQWEMNGNLDDEIGTKFDSTDSSLTRADAFEDITYHYTAPSGGGAGRRRLLEEQPPKVLLNGPTEIAFLSNSSWSGDSSTDTPNFGVFSDTGNHAIRIFAIFPNEDNQPHGGLVVTALGGGNPYSENVGLSGDASPQQNPAQGSDIYNFVDNFRLSNPTGLFIFKPIGDGGGGGVSPGGHSGGGGLGNKRGPKNKRGNRRSTH